MYVDASDGVWLVWTVRRVCRCVVYMDRSILYVDWEIGT